MSLSKQTSTRLTQCHSIMTGATGDRIRDKRFQIPDANHSITLDSLKQEQQEKLVSYLSRCSLFSFASLQKTTIENIVEKGEIGQNEQFTIFPQNIRLYVDPILS